MLTEALGVIFCKNQRDDGWKELWGDKENLSTSTTWPVCGNSDGKTTQKRQRCRTVHLYIRLEMNANIGKKVLMLHAMLSAEGQLEKLHSCMSYKRQRTDN